MVSRERIDDLLHGDVASRDDAARERARLRLRAVMTEESTTPRRRRRRHLALAAAALTAALVALVAQVWLPLGQGGLDSSAAAELRFLGEVSSGRSSSALRQDEFIHRRFAEVRRESSESLSTGLIYSIDVRVDVEVWLSPDGSGKTVTTYRDVAFSSAQDEANWERSGSPEIPHVGQTISRHDAGGLMYYPVHELPTSPDALRQALADGDVIEPAAGDDNELATIGTLLAQEDGDGALRQALFEVAATIPNVTVTNGVVDPLGRPAVEVSVVDTNGTTSLLFDPTDAHFLGRSSTPPPEDERPTLTLWQAYEYGAIVSRIGARGPIPVGTR